MPTQTAIDQVPRHSLYQQYCWQQFLLVISGTEKAGSNWVGGDRIFDRESESQIIRERVLNGTHSLVTALRRMGKMSLVRELLNRLADEGDFDTAFVDLQDAATAVDAVVEFGLRSRHLQNTWEKIRTGLPTLCRMSATAWTPWRFPSCMCYQRHGNRLSNDTESDTSASGPYAIGFISCLITALPVLTISSLSPSAPYPKAYAELAN